VIVTRDGLPVGKLSDASNFPTQGRPATFGNAQAHRLAEAFNVMRRSGAAVDQEIAVFFRYQRIADFQTTAAGGVDFLPGFTARRVGKGAAASANAARLRIAAP
jgi:hypothetical protein